MKINFVYPDTYPDYLNWPGCFYIGIASLSAVLKREGHKTSLIHITQPIEKEEFIARIRSAAPDLIGFSSTSHHSAMVRELTSWLIEEEIRAPTIYGGVHPTLDPEGSIGIDGIDVICRSEGEAPIIELCRRMESGEDYTEIENLWVKSNGTIIQNPIRKLLANLDELPFPDRSFFDYPNLMDEREGVAVFLASKGCPFDCTYCCNHALRKVYGSGNKAVRFRSVDNVIKEIQEVVANSPFINMINFHDDILFLKRAWAKEFADKYPEEVGIPFICNARADITDQTVVDLLQKSGCVIVKFGLESGNEEIRTTLLKRGMSNDQIRTAVQMCSKAGLKTLSFNIVGLPTETPAAILDTIKLNAETGIDYAQVSIYRPYHGTELAEICDGEHLIAGEDLGPSFYSHSHTVLRMKTVSASQITMFKEYFSLLIRYYRALQGLPPALSRVSIAWSDKILSLEPTATIMNLLYVPLDALHSLVQQFKLKSKVARVRAAGQARMAALEDGDYERNA